MKKKSKFRNPPKGYAHQIYVDAETWKGVKQHLKAVGLSRSRFVELLFRAVIDSEAKTFREVQGDLFSGLLGDAARSMMSGKAAK